MNSIYVWVLLYSSIFHVDPKLALSVIDVESHFNSNARGDAGEIGLMQLMPGNFPNVPPAALKDPETNLRLGIEYLSKIKKECVHKKDDTFLVCWNMGSPKGNKVRYPKRWHYYKEVMAEYAKLQEGQ